LPSGGTVMNPNPRAALKYVIVPTIAFSLPCFRFARDFPETVTTFLIACTNGSFKKVIC